MPWAFRGVEMQVIRQDPRFLDDELAAIRRMEHEDFAKRHPEWFEAAAPQTLLDTAADRAEARRFECAPPATWWGSL